MELSVVTASYRCNDSIYMKYYSISNKLTKHWCRESNLPINAIILNDDLTELVDSTTQTDDIVINDINLNNYNFTCIYTNEKSRTMRLNVRDTIGCSVSFNDLSYFNKILGNDVIISIESIDKINHSAVVRTNGNKTVHVSLQQLNAINSKLLAEYFVKSNLINQ